VAISFRLFPPRRLLRRTLALAVALSAALAVASSPAGAIITTVGSTNVGLQPRSTTLFTPASAPNEFANTSGAPIVSTNKTYGIYWDPTDHYHGDWQHVVDTFFQNMGAASGSLASVFAVDAQYTDAANQHALYQSTFQGAYTDTDGYPESGCEDPHPLEVPDLIGRIVGGKHTVVCLTDTQIREELEQFVASHSLQKGMGTIFYLMTPPGVTVCLDKGGTTGHCSDFVGTIAEVEADEKTKVEKEIHHETYVEPVEYKSYKNSFCSYHSDISPTNAVTGDGNTILYGVVPWTAGGLGDGHLTAADENTPSFECQDGGFDPSSKPTIEKREEKKEVKKNLKKEEEEPLTQEEKELQEKKEALEGPHQEEPNQIGLGPDGFYDTGLADMIVNQIAVEQQNIVTDPLLNAWHDPKSNEATDECRNYFSSGVLGGSVGANEQTSGGTLSNQTLTGGAYYLNDAFNLAALKLPYPGVPCLSGVRLEPVFTAPNPVNAKELVGFDGMESDISLNWGVAFSPTGEPHTTYALYTWNFGDGSAPISGYAPGAPSANSPEVAPCAALWEAPCAASTYHSYQYGGTYQVTLTVTDVGGNTATFTEPITVNGPPAPLPTPPAGGGSSGSGAAPATASPPPPAPSTGPSTVVPVLPTVPAPVVSGFATSKSLKKVLSGGLAIRYTTNEQVAGSIQVLLESATAKRLGVHGATATGLPAGTPRSIVVGTAVLVTTKGGQGTIRIKFSPRTAARLKHVRKLKLVLRLFARNAARQSPRTTTVLSTVVLNP
jgi:hypothetical protein